MEESIKAGSEVSQLTSAAAFVEGGIQDACDDACSICLEEFCDSDPSTVTNCKHEFHLQCVLEWCQRSSKCPMCWQDISLKDPSSQELLDAVEHERRLRSIPARQTAIFRHPTLGNIELQNLPVGMDNAELEDRILQHLAVAMGRTHRIVRREDSQNRPDSHSHEFFVYRRNETSDGQESHPTEPTGNSQSGPMSNQGLQRAVSSPPINHVLGSSSGSSQVQANENRNSVSESSSSPNPDRAGPSEQSFSDTWRSRLSSMSMKYKESISKSTKEWKEKLFSRSSSMADIGSEVRREVNAGLATVSQMMERLESRNNSSRGSDRGTTSSRLNEESNTSNGRNSAPFVGRSI